MKKNAGNDLTSGDLFAGAGGLSIGFHEAGFTPVFFNEIDEQAALTFSRNFPSVVPFTCPIQELTAERVRDETALASKTLDILIGGPPCQGFSINAPIRSDADPRNHLFLHYIRILEGLRPKFVVMENVPGLISMGQGDTLRSVIASFKNAGYETAFRILNAAHYGVPQERWRLILIGTRLPGVKLSFPPPIQFSLQIPNFTGGREYTFVEAIGNGKQRNLFLQPPTTVREAINDLSMIGPGGEDEADYPSPPNNQFQREMRRDSGRVFNHICANLSLINLQRIRYVKPGGSWRDIPYELLPKGMQRARRSDHTRRYGRLDPERPSGTILTKCDPHWGTVIHYEQDRIISVREAARLQSFPDRFYFTGSKSDQYRQVGNAVPPLMAKAIAEHIKLLMLEATGADQYSFQGEGQYATG